MRRWWKEGEKPQNAVNLFLFAEMAFGEPEEVVVFLSSDSAEFILKGIWPLSR